MNLASLFPTLDASTRVACLVRYVAAAVLFCESELLAQAPEWQQRADYTIESALDVATHQYAGQQTVVYTNNSPDTLTQFYFHLYPNAFQPGSMMDVRSRTIADPDRRVGDRIAALTPEEQGYLRITQLTQDGARASVSPEETIGVVDLVKGILPGEEVTFELSFEGQVPQQIRRSGRDNAEGIDYSMPQWYPKVSEYDARGWHANPYIAREFHGVWGDFDVTVALDADYVFAGTGYPTEVVQAFYDEGIERKIRSGEYAVHRHLAPRVHDFTWAADRDYRRDTLRRDDGLLLEFYYQPGEQTSANWEQLPAIMSEAFDYIKANFGTYPYEKYAFIQGGDGGMEYAMCTLITGERNLTSLVGVSVHELLHSWYQFVLATDESLYPWMDEGFTSFASAETMNHLRAKGLLPGSEPEDNPHLGTVEGYARFANSGRAEVMSMHSDHYTTNAAYSVGSYVKGELFLYQLRSIIGEEAFGRGTRRYFATWQFRHPTPVDFLRIMEKESGQELDWYLDYMMNTNHQVDYAVDTVMTRGDSVNVVLRRVGGMPFPIDVSITDGTGQSTTYLIPMVIQRGHAPLEGRTLAADWPWVNPTYTLTVPGGSGEVQVQIDPNQRVSEASRDDDVFPRVAEAKGLTD